MVADPALERDREARRDALDVSRSFIVQAPAGSGKTELLIQRYLALLALVEHPEEVLAITFTRKAAAEMRLRVSAALARARSGSTPEEAHLKLTNELALRVLSRDSKKSWGLDDNPGRLRIQTLDALNAQITRMQPLTTAAATVGNRILSDSGLSEIYERAAAATLDHLDTDGTYRDAVSTVLSHLDNDTGRYLRHLAEMLRTRDQWLPLIGVQGGDAFSDIRKTLERTLALLVKQQLEALEELFPKEAVPELLALAGYADSNLEAEGTPAEAVAGMQRLPDRHDVAAWISVMEFLLTKGGTFRKRLTVNDGFPKGDGEPKAWKQRFADLTETLARVPSLESALERVALLPAARYEDTQWEVLESLLILLILASAELKRLFLATGSVDYIEIALDAKRALGEAEDPGQVALLLDYQLKHILVDEMQDTSIGQYDFLKRLVDGWTPGDGRTLFCVGDPMQSIYRFRNAEVAQFLDAKQRGIGDVHLEPLLLQQNFRSGSRLVDWFNESFSSIFAPRDEPNRGAVSYAHAVAAPHLAGAGDVVFHPVLGTSTDAEAKATADVIENLLASKPDDDVVVLVRSRTQVQELIPELRRRRCHFRAVDIDRLTDLPEIIDLLILTRAAAHQGDRHAWLALLRSPAFGLDWRDLLALVTGDRETPVPLLLDDQSRLAALSESGLALIETHRSAIEALKTGGRFRSLAERVETLWYRLASPALLKDASAVENAQRFLTVLAGLESGGTLADVARLEQQLDAERVSSVSDARLQLMTMHKSKGLQFDHVVLHGIGRASASTEKTLVNWIEAVLPDRQSPILAPIKPTEASDEDPIYRYIHSVNKEKDEFERQRLLYVAATRAKRSLQLVGHTTIQEKDGSLAKPRKGTLLDLLWPMAEATYEDAHRSGQTVYHADDGPEWLMPQRRIIQEHGRRPDVSMPTLRGTRSAANNREVQFEWAGQEAKVAGTIVHRWLQMAVEDGLSLSTLDSDARQSREGRWLRQLGIADERVVYVRERVDQALRTMRDDARAAWILESEGDAELELTGVVDGALTSGIIDRVLIDEGEHWIIDYKTGYHEGGGLDRFLDDEQRRYSGQLYTYKTLYEGLTGVKAKTALYYPLMALFVEVQPNGRNVEL